LSLDGTTHRARVELPTVFKPSAAYALLNGDLIEVDTIMVNYSLTWSANCIASRPAAFRRALDIHLAKVSRALRRIAVAPRIAPR
jgi:hypothetical protein